MAGKHAFFLLTISLILLLAVSCDIDSLSSHQDVAALYGEWKSEIDYEYTASIYDYGSSSKIVIDLENTITETKSSFIKSCDEKEKWAPNLSKPDVTSGPYYIKIYPTYTLEGYMDIYDPKTLENKFRVDYTFSEDHNTLTLKKDKKSRIYSRVSE